MSEFVILDDCLLVSIPKFLYSMLPKPVQFAVQFPKAQFMVQFHKTVRYSVQVSTGADRQFLNLNASLVLQMDRPGSSWKALSLRNESTVMSLSKMASKSGETPASTSPQVHYFLGTCDPHRLPSSFGGCESYQVESSPESNFHRSCSRSARRH
jgi:hypothetical protein